MKIKVFPVLMISMALTMAAPAVVDVKDQSHNVNIIPPKVTQVEDTAVIPGIDTNNPTTIPLATPKKVIQLPIYNTHKLNLDTVHAMDIERWSPIDDSLGPGKVQFSASDSSKIQKTKPIPAVNLAVHYNFVCGLGTPFQPLELIFDTGSSLLWVQSPFYDPTRSNTSTRIGTKSFSIAYGSGETKGEMYRDKLIFGDGDQAAAATTTVIGVDQEFGFASQVSGLRSSVNGIIGFGPEELGKVTHGVKNVSTPMTNLVNQGLIDENIFGLYLEPMQERDFSIRNGQVTLGGYDLSKVIKGQEGLSFVNLTEKDFANRYWGLDFQSVNYGQEELGINKVGIADSGTTLILVSERIMDGLMDLIPGSEIDSKTSLLTFPKSSIPGLKPISFVIANGDRLTLQPEQYMLRSIEKSRLRGSSEKEYAWIGSRYTGYNMDVILGQKFLEQFYTIWDAKNRKLGFGISASSTAVTEESGKSSASATSIAARPTNTGLSVVPPKPQTPVREPCSNVICVVCRFMGFC